jgi:hypothetical protein
MTREEASLFFRCVGSEILDRLRHKAYVLNIKGRIYRLRDIENLLSSQ